VVDAPRKHLLVVDDEPVILQILRAVLQEEPLRLTLTDSGAEALRVIEQGGVDLLLTDKNLPDVGGLQLLRAAKARDPLTEVILLTGYGSLDTALSAIEHDVFDYVLKPLNNVFDLRKKVRQALAKQEVALENRRLIAELQVRNAELADALAQARALQDELVQSEKLAGIGTLAAGVAHEISSPLFGILGLAEAIADESDLSLAQGYAREIVEYCGGIRDIVSDLSGYTRAPAADFESAVDVSRAVHDALRLIERSVPVEGVRFEVEAPPGLDVHARATELQQVFVNLLRNAVEAVRGRHAAGGGRVVLRASRLETHVIVTVADDGPGIPEGRRRLIFDPFFTTKPAGQGTGLGLNIVYRLVTKYHGSVTVGGIEGSGAVFEVRLPAAGPSRPIVA
jgi:C4-dicarboxylate-specific signal transduction histidine kinase